MEVYNLEAIVTLAFHIGTFGAERVRNAVLEILYLRKEKTSIFFSLNTNGYIQIRILLVAECLT